MKLKKVLRAVHKQFSSPPPEVLAEKSVNPFLEDPDFDEDKLREMINSHTNAEQVVKYALQTGRQDALKTKTHMKSPMKSPMKSGGDVSASSQGFSIPSSSSVEEIPFRSGAEVEDSPYSKVYENLYYLIAQVPFSFS